MDLTGYSCTDRWRLPSFITVNVVHGIVSEEQIRSSLAAMSQMANQLEDEARRIQAVIAQAIAAIDAIRGLSDGEPSVLIQIGMGAMLKAKITKSDTIPVNVGAGIVVEKTPDSAINYLESRIKEMDVSLKNILAEHKNVAMEMEQAGAKLAELNGPAPHAPQE